MIVRLFQRLMQAGESMLRASHAACSYCRHPVRDPAGLTGLCARCAGEVPWITSVQCAVCGRAEQCGDCMRRKDEERFLAGNRSAVRYDDQMKQWLAAYKYRGDERLGALLVAMLVQMYRHHWEQEPYCAPRPTWITSVPVSEQRLEQRGFNQAEQLARGVAAALGVPYIALLRRTRDTAKQSHKNRRERIDDLQDAFALALPVHDPVFTNGIQMPIHILIIDDVYTTGSTLHSCARTIRQTLDACVYGLTWAR